MNDGAIPEVLGDLIEQVVRSTRLWPAEKRDVRAELESHFRDGLEQLAQDELDESEAVALLRERFGEPKVAAKLIRRGKKRSRSMAWKVFMRATGGLAILIGATTAYAGWLVLGEPNPSVDYISKMNEPIDAIPLEDRAWPILKEAILDLNPMPEELSEVTKRFAFLTVDDDRWEDAMAWVESNRHLIPKIHRAASKRMYGARYDNAENLEFRIALAERRQGEKDREEEAQLAKWRRCAEKNRQMLSVLLPGIQETRTVARLLTLDARGHLANGDFDAGWLSLESAHRLGLQLLTTGVTIIEQLYGTRITDVAGKGMKRALYEYQDQLEAQDLDRLSTSLMMIDEAGRACMNYEFEEYLCEDVVQYLFTDNGDGDGVLIPSAFKDFRVGTSGDKPEERNQWKDEYESLAVAVVHAGRKETLAKYAELWEMNKKRFSVPLYDPEWRRVEEAQGDMFSDPLMTVRFALVKSLMPSLERAEMMGREARMNRQATQVVVALLRYRADHGGYPESLDALVPAYLEQVPVDVFCGEGFRYALGEDGSMRLYSVGRNLVDDGGSSTKIIEKAAFARFGDPADILYWPPGGR